VTVNKGPLDSILLYVPLQDFYIDMSDDGLSTGQILYRTSKRHILI